MQHLADLIRRGLATPGIVEDKEIYGAGPYEGAPHANIVGLALIGKVGMERAMELFETAVGEFGAEECPATLEIQRELGVDPDVMESMVVREYTTSAAEIADELEAGTFKVV